jgi:hypothetical protein
MGRPPFKFWPAIQGVCAIYLALLATWDHFHPLGQPTPQFTSVEGPVTQAPLIPALPKGIWLALLALALSVVIPACIALWRNWRNPRLTVRSALWGTGPENDVDVAPLLQKLPRDALVVHVTRQFLKCDPIEGPAKRLEVQYSYGNSTVLTVTRPEYSRLTLPEDSYLNKQLELSRGSRTDEIERISAENIALKARLQSEDSRPQLAKLAVKHDRVLNHKTGPDESYEVLWIQNTQLSIPFTAQYVSARIKFTLEGGADSCTITESLWIYEHTDKGNGFVSSSVPSWVDIEGSEKQALVIAVRKSDEALLLRDSRGATAHFFPRDTAWDAAITVVSDNTEPLNLKTKLTVFPNGEFQWSPVSEVEAL